jgi:type II secretory pathway pseudopilin PulG
MLRSTMKARSLGNIRASRGIATLEILIAFAILTLTLTAMIVVAFGNQSISIDTQTNSEAIAIARSQLEAARAASLQNFSSVIPQSPISVPSGPLTFSKKLDVSTIDTYTKQATSTVTWVNGGRSFHIVLSTLLTDFSTALASGSCNPALSGDWTNPQHTDFKSYDLISPGSGNNSDGLGVSDIKVVGHKMYLTALSTSNFKPTFYVFDLPNNPTLIPVYDGSIDNNASSDDGLNSVAVERTSSHVYAFVTNSHDANFQTCIQGPSCSQLQVIDATTPSAPSVLFSYKLPGVLGNMVSTNQAVGKTIFYDKGYVYLGLTKTASGPEFNIIDVSTPSNPVVVGSYPIGHTVESIYVKDNYAYVATDDNTRELTVFDITNKSAPAQVGQYNAPLNDAPGNNSGLGNSVFVKDTNVYLGRTYSLSNGDPEFVALDDTNPATTLPVAGSKDIGTGATPDSINGLAVRQNLAFMWTKTAFQIWNMNTATSPFTISAYASIPMSAFITSGLPSNAAGTSLSCTGNYFYLSLVSPQGNNKDIVSVVTPYFPSSYSLTNGGDITVVQGTSGNTTLTKTITSWFPPGEALAASGLPAGATAIFTNGSCTPNCSGSIAISTSPGVAPGTYPITVSGASGASTIFNLVVTALPPFDYSLTNSGDITITHGNTGPITITRTLVSGATTPVNISSVTGLPSHTSVQSITNNPCGPSCASVMTLRVLNSESPGTYTITVQGNPNGIGIRTTQFHLKVI